jgi:hypothetical protein
LDASELDIALDELETRLDRLRGLYDQYFMGLEKIEPAVARKDVDRRIWLLRKEKVRNTAKRFKLQTLIQRYNTFQQYWQRICREIEAGTYKRHLLRAEKQFGPTELLTITSRRRFRHRNAGPNEPSSDAPSEPPAAATVEGDDTARALGRAAAATTAGFPVAEPMTQSDTQFAAATGIRERSPVEPKPVSPGSSAQPATAQEPAPPKPVRQLASLDLDLDFGPPPPKPSPPKAPPAPAPVQPVSPPEAATAQEPVAPARRDPEPQRRLEPAAGQSAGGGDRTGTGQSAGGGAPAPSGSLDEAKLKRIHERLTAARKATDDQTPVSLDKLAKSLRDAETRLRAQHANRTIDFAVVIKDGKAIVKPVLR